MSSSTKVVLVVGATGAVGRKVVKAVRARGHHVRALVRSGSDPRAIEGDGVSIARGDMMDPPSLEAAMRGADAVITTAAGYTKRRKGDSARTDIDGNRNLADAARAVRLGRFVLCSILTADQTPDVPHFWHKKLAEDYLQETGVPFVALRPGAFLDQAVDFFADRVRKGSLLSFGAPNVPMTYVYTDDLASNLAHAVDLPADANGLAIDLGWDRPVSTNDLASIIGELRGEALGVKTIPWWFLGGALGAAGLVSGMARDLRAMFRHFQSGRYVADTALQSRYFGVPRAEDVLRRWLTSRGLVTASPGAA
ncbi:MAG: SDR family oxidoreductase [Polyangiaceae bacterium]|nr:SDR family oxidoreductase [Polyangiaceae bacterium]